MPQIVNTNTLSLNAQRNLNSSESLMSRSLQRLSSGLRINSAKDDAAGLSIGERFTSQINGMEQAARNAADGISLAQTAEGALNEVTSNLQRIRVLAVQAANASNSNSDRRSLNAEVVAIKSEISRVLDGTAFNGISILGAAVSIGFQIGTDAESTTNRIYVTTSVLTSNATIMSALAAGINTIAAALSTINKMDNAINYISSKRSEFGAMQNRFESIVANTQITAENIAASKSRMYDTDFAVEMAEMTRAQILQQAGTAMLSHANTVTSSVLNLL
ncbi:MAG: flagellin [Gammaproteobacteria bacterium]|nr:flagellin [Gammaproteobacteria bacterium]MDH5730792.1 flagellin [Gammaproteobacteria bacterium]